MSPLQPLPPKKDVALALLERSSVYVYLDPRQVAVVVPPKFKEQAQLVLQVGLNMVVPIPDLRLDDDGMSCTLSFNRAPFFCVVPWGSVFAMVDDKGRGMVWPEDVPAEVTRTQVRLVDTGVQKESSKAGPAAERQPKGDAPKARRARKGPVLAAVSGAEKEVPKKAVKTAGLADRRPNASPAPAPRGPTTTTGAPSPAVAQVPAARVDGARAGKKKRKKELPPYLRVVK